MNFDKIIPFLEYIKKNVNPSFYSPKRRSEININILDQVKASDQEEIPWYIVEWDQVKAWYIEEWRKQFPGTFVSIKSLQERVFVPRKDKNGQIYMYYPSERNDIPMLYGTTHPEKNLEKMIENGRQQMIELAIREYLERILKEIKITPLTIRENEVAAAYNLLKLSAKGTNSEEIEMNINDEHGITLEINKPSHALYVYAVNSIASILYSGNVIVPNTETELPPTKKPRFSFKKAKPQPKDDGQQVPISVIKDYVRCQCSAYGSVYNDGVYIFYTEDEQPNKFVIKYYDQDTITFLLSQSFEKNESLYFWQLSLKEMSGLRKDFCTQLEKEGILPDASASTECSSEQIQEYANNAFHNPRAVMEELNKSQHHDK